jgi:hypothetical protein
LTGLAKENAEKQALYITLFLFSAIGNFWGDVSRKQQEY